MHSARRTSAAVKNFRSELNVYSNRMRRVFLVPAIFLSIYLVLCLAGGIFIADGALHPMRRPIDYKERMNARQVAEAAGSRLQDVSLKTTDGIVLKAWLIQPAKDNGNSVLLLHGLGDNRGGTLGYADLLLASGYSVLMPDARAHGESGGELATYGLLERQDIHRWADWMKDQFHPGCVFGLGESMGAAQLLESLAETHFCAVVAESSFSNFLEIAYDRMGQPFGIGPWLGETLLRPVISVAYWRAEYRYGLHMQQVSPEAALRDSRTPVLLIHGADDHNIPPRHSELLFRTRVQNTEIWRVPSADHCGAISTAPEEFARRLLSFYAAHATSPTPAALAAR